MLSFLPKYGIIKEKMKGGNDMAIDLTEPLVIGIGSRALFDLEKENEIFE